jgi:hypothetical protein
MTIYAKAGVYGGIGLPAGIGFIYPNILRLAKLPLVHSVAGEKMDLWFK